MQLNHWRFKSKFSGLWRPLLLQAALRSQRGTQRKCREPRRASLLLKRLAWFVAVLRGRDSVLTWKDEQRAALKDFLGGKDVFAWLATGFSEILVKWRIKASHEEVVHIQWCSSHQQEGLSCCYRARPAAAKTLDANHIPDGNVFPWWKCEIIQNDLGNVHCWHVLSG